VCLFAASGAVACHGGTAARDESGGETDPVATVGGTNDPVDVGSDDDDVEPADVADAYPFMRLTRREYDNTVRDLLGTSLRLAESFPTEPKHAGGFVQPGPVSTLEAQLYMEAAETLAAEAVADLDALLPCDPAVDERACVQMWIAELTRKAYRRPATSDEEGELLALFDQARVDGDALPDAIAFVLQAVLQSPSFLYKWEVTTPPGDDEHVALGAHQVASRLSYLLWGTMPDAELRRAADAGELDDEAGLAAQAERMIADPRVLDTFVDFNAQWLELRPVDTLQKNPEVYPQFTADVRNAMRAETEAFLRAVLLDGDGSLRTLLTADWTVADDVLAPIYGATTAMGTLELDATQRSGLLTQLLFLASGADDVGSHPVRRGKTVMTRVLCMAVPPPPADVPQPSEPEPGETTRQRFEKHGANECASCHVTMDPLGFAFEHYDAIGGWRDLDNGQLVDASGRVTLPDGTEVAFADAIELTAALADSRDVSRCFAQQWFRYTYGRLEDHADETRIDDVHARFVDTDLDIRELVLALVGESSFRLRKRTEGESD
jgi:hypothetical protein